MTAPSAANVGRLVPSDNGFQWFEDLRLVRSAFVIDGRWWVREGVAMPERVAGRDEAKKYVEGATSV